MKAKLLRLLEEKNSPSIKPRILDLEIDQKKGMGNLGVAALPTLLLVGGIIMAISISLTTSIYLYVNSIQGANLGSRALSIAKSGVYDGLLRVARDKSFSGPSYTFSVNNQSAVVDICGKICVGEGRFRISSVGSVLTRRKKIEAIVSVNPVTGLVRLESMLEVAL